MKKSIPCFYFLIFIIFNLGNSGSMEIEINDNIVKRTRKDNHKEFTYFPLPKKPRLEISLPAPVGPFAHFSFFDIPSQYRISQSAKKKKGIRELLKKTKDPNYLTQTIIISGLKLNKIPREILSLHCLEILKLSNVGPCNLPPEISSLKNLKYLYLQNNGLEIYPSAVNEILSLEFLDLSGNNFQHIPATISQLINLTALDLRNNKLSIISQDILFLPNLTRLLLANNPLEPLNVFVTSYLHSKSLIIYLQQIEEAWTVYKEILVFPILVQDVKKDIFNIYLQRFLDNRALQKAIKEEEMTQEREKEIERILHNFS